MPLTDLLNTNLFTGLDIGAVRDITGANNNALNPLWGKAGTAIGMTGQVDYADGIGAPSGEDRPSPREISNEIFAQTTNIPSVKSTSNFLWMWGQLLDHDISLSPTTPAEKLYIQVPQGDPYFDPFGTGTQTIPLERSVIEAGSGTDTNNPREQINSLTTWLDASHVYGSDPVREAFLRTDGGYLKTSDGDLMPFNTAGLPNGNSNPFVQSTDLFIAGDVRANENSGLITIHTLFMREHNVMVDELKSANPDWTDEQLHQTAKALVEAKMQAITYNQFLPILVGENAIPDYTGYNPSIDPTVVSEFSSAAYRIGHTLLNGTLTRMAENGDITDTASLRDVFFNPSETVENGIDSLVRGQAATQSQNLDHFIIDDVRNFLFGPPGAGGLDLVSLNIMRARDHGVPSYNDVREAYGLTRITSFSDITGDAVLAGKLEALYEDVDNIDLFAGGLCEDPYQGGLVGETFNAILVDQFVRLRDGDQFWYENRFEGQILEDLQQTTLADIIRKTTDIKYIQEDVFFAADRIAGDDTSNDLYGDDSYDLLIGNGGDDILTGDGGNDSLYGGEGNDILMGGDGADYLDGEDGSDTLSGGTGSDTFLFDPNDSIDAGTLENDTLNVEDDQSTDFTFTGKLNGIDVLDLTDGDADNATIHIQDVLDLTDNNALFVMGDDGLDCVEMPDVWAVNGNYHLFGYDFALYSMGHADIYVENGLIMNAKGGLIT